MSKDQVLVLRLKLGRPAGVSPKTMKRMLQESSRMCMQARNCMIQQWLSDRMQHPWWPERDKKGAYKNQPYRPEFAKAPDGTTAYLRLAAKFPRLAGTLVSSCEREILNHLKAKTPWDRKGEATRRWESYLIYEASPPSFRDVRIPVPNAVMNLTWNEKCMFDTVLFGKKDDSGLPRRLQVELLVSRFSTGQKFWLRKAIVGARRRKQKEVVDNLPKICDSSIVWNQRKRCWFLHLVLKHSQDELQDSQQEAVLHACYDAKQRSPFELEVPGGRRIPVGFGIPVVREHARVSARRAAIQHNYRHGTGRGRGRRKFYGAMHASSRRMDWIKDSFACQLAERVLQLCREHHCGRLVYREPSRYLRQFAWFEKQDVPINWTTIETRLAGRCLKDRVVFVSNQLKKEEAEREGVIEFKSKSNGVKS